MFLTTTRTHAMPSHYHIVLYDDNGCWYTLDPYWMSLTKAVAGAHELITLARSGKALKAVIYNNKRECVCSVELPDDN